MDFPKIPMGENKLLSDCSEFDFLTHCDLYFNLANVFLAKVFPWNSALTAKEICLWNDHLIPGETTFI